MDLVDNRIINALPAGTLLRGKRYDYVIQKTLGQGSFGITYLASVRMAGDLGSINVDIKVAIKEFFMKSYNGRENTSVISSGSDGTFDASKRRFIREARNLGKLQHPHIIKVVECFETNNTVYYSMEYLSNGSLDDFIRTKGHLAENEAISLARQIANALAYMHAQGMLHLDLKPGNIMMRSSSEIALIDFGLAKLFDAEGNLETLSTIGVGRGTPGYAPLEQANYQEGMGFPATMDIYALGATMYKMLTGQRPPEASEILNDGLPDKPSSVSSEAWAAVEIAMEPMRKKRPQTVSDWLTLLPNTNVSADDGEATIIDFTTTKPNATANDNILKFTVKGISFNMIKVEGGTFMMGATEEQKGDAWDDEMPVHQVTLTSYYIGQTEVTQALWKAVMGKNPVEYDFGDNRPVTNVSWDDCQDFVIKMNQLTGKRFRLPTEAEWEYACRGGKKSRGYKYSGSNTIDDVAWYYDNSSSKTHPVATKSPNELGIYDMSGNVWEWCQDWYGRYSSNAQTNPTGASSGSSRVNRGGSWNRNAKYCRSSNRGSYAPDDHYGSLGLRLTLSE